jgi:hypothetical protein
MYSTCLFCNGNLGTNEIVEHFPIGRRLAFDASRGRLWVVCGLCSRWNLTPIEERHEAIEECERRFRGTYVRVSTDQIGLARLREGLELIRIGEPLRPEFAAWRYAGEFFSRRHRSYARAGAMIGAYAAASAGLGMILGPIALAAGGMSIVAFPVVAMGMVAIPLVGGEVAQEYLQHERILGRFSHGNRVITVRAKHARSIDLGLFPGGDASLGFEHDTGRLHFAGTQAIHATTVLLANANRTGATKRVVQDAVNQIEQSGTAEGFLEMASRRNGWRKTKSRQFSVLNTLRKLGPMNLSVTERLALEMSVHEETERRAFLGELGVLEEAWRGAEEIAGICDGLLTPPQLDDWLRGRPPSS